MDQLMQWGITVILALQHIPSLTGMMKFYSFFGTEEFFLIVMPMLYWCVDASLGLRLAVILIASSGLNSFLKVTFHLPRPYWFDARVKALSAETSYGMPSGHAMSATSAWGFLALQLNRWWTWAAALLLIFLISLSRLYLGVHFPTDVLGGWLGGAVVLALFAASEHSATVWLKARPVWQLIALAAAASLIYLALWAGLLALLAGQPDPAQWAQTAAAAGPIAPRNPDDAITGGGMILGLGAALALRRPFDARGPWLKRGLRLGIGLLGILVFWLGLKLVTPAEPFVVEAAFRYGRYALAIFWALYLAPEVFLRLNLAEPL